MSKFIVSPPNRTSTTIEDLPEELVVHILSFLYTHDAIQASFVSRKFRNLWHSIPSLSFDNCEFDSTNRLKPVKNSFQEFVSSTLSHRQHYPLNKFVFSFMCPGNPNKNQVKNWIRYAIGLNVSQLFVTCSFDFLLSDIGERGINVLEVCHCNLVLPLETNPIRFVSLKSLKLEAFEIDGNDVCNLLARCVNLETLKLVLMKFGNPIGGLRIYSSTLKELNMDKCLGDIPSPFDLEICCPNLRKISLINCHIEKYITRDTTLVEEWVDFVPFCQINNRRCEELVSHFSNIFHLNVWHEVLESNEVPVGCEQYASNVKHLELCCAYREDDLVSIAALLKVLPKLEILGLRNSGTKGDSLDQDLWGTSIVFNMPCLRKVKLKNYQQTEREQHFIELFKKNGIVLDKIELLK